MTHTYATRNPLSPQLRDDCHVLLRNTKAKLGGNADVDLVLAGRRIKQVIVHLRTKNASTFERMSRLTVVIPPSRMYESACDCVSAHMFTFTSRAFCWSVQCPRSAIRSAICACCPTQ